MLRIYPLLIAFLLIFVGLPTAHTQVKYSNEFLAIGVGAKAQGMANAQVASVNDVTAGYWNPAGLTQLKAPFQLGAMHAEWFAGVAQYDYLAFAKPLNKANKAAIGLSVIRLGIDQIPNTLNLIGPDGAINYNNVTEFSAADYAILFSYGQEVKIKDRTLAVGGNAKIVRRVIGTFGNSWGFGLDLGAMYKVDKWRFGLMARDITTTFNAWSFSLTDQEKLVFSTTGNDVPESSLEITRPKIILGTAHQRAFSDKVDFLAEINLDFTTDGQRNVLISSKAFNIDPHLGFELGYNKFIFLRGGIGNIQESLDDFDSSKSSWTVQPNFGLGLRLGRFHIDYALTDIGNVSEVLYSHIFSLSLNFRTRTTD